MTSPSYQTLDLVELIAPKYNGELLSESCKLTAGYRYVVVAATSNYVSILNSDHSTSQTIVDIDCVKRAPLRFSDRVLLDDKKEEYYTVLSYDESTGQTHIMNENGEDKIVHEARLTFCLGYR